VNLAAIQAVEPGSYVSHELHKSGRLWSESNCYIDVWIELLHFLQCEPLASLPFVLGVDWEGDQFTFLKPPGLDFVQLYGVDVRELNVYRPLLDHAVEHLGAGRLILTEADAFYLPDTRGMDYRSQHTKTTIAIQAIDVRQRKLGYFHNSGYHTLTGDDFVAIFRLEAEVDPLFMPLFAELVRTAGVVRLPPDLLVQRSVSLLKEHLARRPRENPGSRFAGTVAADLERLQREGLGAYHLYAFATLRQLGSAFELADRYLGWLSSNGESGLEACARGFRAISETSKSLLLKMARAVTSKKDADLRPMLADIERDWESSMNLLVQRYDIA
jgi:hypothetical protein